MWVKLKTIISHIFVTEEWMLSKMNAFKLVPNWQSTCVFKQMNRERGKFPKSRPCPDLAEGSGHAAQDKAVKERVWWGWMVGLEQWRPCIRPESYTKDGAACFFPLTPRLSAGISHCLVNSHSIKLLFKLTLGPHKNLDDVSLCLKKRTLSALHRYVFQ